MDEELEKRTTPQGLLRYAQEYFNAYKIINDKEPDKIKLYQVKFYLLCHAVELALKAYLKHKGYALKVLKSQKFGHDLKKLIDELMDKHQFLFSKDDYIRLCMINDYYCTKQLEYFRTGYKALPDIKEVEGITNLIVQVIFVRVHNIDLLKADT